jgi:hypothetical protein
MCVQLIFTPYSSSHLIWHFGFIFCLEIPWITFIFNWAGDLVVFDSFKNCSLSLIVKVTLFQFHLLILLWTFWGLLCFILENSEIQFLLSINKLHMSWQLLKFVLFKSQISFIIRKLLCRNEVNTIGLFLKVIEELQNILVFRMESMSLLHNWISSCNFDHSILGDRFVE